MTIYYGLTEAEVPAAPTQDTRGLDASIANLLVPGSSIEASSPVLDSKALSASIAQLAVPGVAIAPAVPITDTEALTASKTLPEVPGVPITASAPTVDTISQQKSFAELFVPGVNIDAAAPLLDTWIIFASKALLEVPGAAISAESPTVDTKSLIQSWAACLVPGANIVASSPVLDTKTQDTSNTNLLVPGLPISPSSPVVDTNPLDPSIGIPRVPGLPIDTPVAVYPSVEFKGGEYLWRNVTNWTTANSGTINFWIRNRHQNWNNTNMTIIAFNDGETPRMELNIEYQLGNQRIEWEIDNGTTTEIGGWDIPIATIDLNDGNWHMVTLTSGDVGTGVRNRLFIDNVAFNAQRYGSEDALNTWFHNIGGPITRISMGAFYRDITADQFLYGSLDEFTLSSVAYSSTQRSLVWNLGSGVLIPQMNLYPSVWSTVYAAWELTNDGQAFGKDFLNTYDLTSTPNDESLFGDSTGIPGIQ